MMYWLLETCLVNAIVASLMAAAVWLLGRFMRRPALLHALWVLVLLKLITPPLFELPIGIRLDPLAQHAPSVEPQVLNESELAFPGRPAETPTMSSDAPLRSSMANAVSPPAQMLPADAAEAPPIVASQPADAASQAALPACCSWISAASTPLALWNRVNWGNAAFYGLLSLWALGSLTWFMFITWRLARFFQFLRFGHPAALEIVQLVNSLSAQLSMTRAPDVTVIDARFSPMLWAGFGPARIILPGELVDRLDRSALETLLLHELAHYHRRDHWVRLLEVLVTGLFWWHPAVWLARGEIEASEEQCCDAWVVGHFASEPRRYAEALLQTIEFLAEQRSVALVPAVSRLGEANFLRRRITMIFEGVAPKSLTRTARCVVTAVAICILALGPQVFVMAASSRLEVAAIEADRYRPLAEPESVVPLASSPDVAPSKKRRSRKADYGSGQAYDAPPATPYVADVSPWVTAISSDGRFELTGRTDGSTRLLDRATERERDLTSYHVAAAAFSPDAQWLAIACHDQRVVLIESASGDEFASFHPAGGKVRTVAFAPEGNLLAASAGNSVHLFDLTTLAPLDTIKASKAAVNCVRFSPNGECLAIASGSWMTPSEGQLLLWNLREATLQATLDAGLAYGTTAFADDNRLIAADWDGSAIAYDLNSQRVFQSLQIDKNLVSRSAFSPCNGPSLAEAIDEAIRQRSQWPFDAQFPAEHVEAAAIPEARESLLQAISGPTI